MAISKKIYKGIFFFLFLTVVLLYFYKYNTQENNYKLVKNQFSDLPDWNSKNILPSVTIYIYIDVELSINRRASSDNDRMESNGKEFLINVKNGYDELASLYSDRICVVNGRESILEIHENIKKILREKFKGLIC